MLPRWLVVVQASTLAALYDILHLCTFLASKVSLTKTLNHYYLCWWRLAVELIFLAHFCSCSAICGAIATTIATVYF